MLFYPQKYAGLRPFGWQGIIPANSQKMAEMSVDLMVGTLLKIDEIFARLEPRTISAKVSPQLKKISVQIIDEAMEAQAPTLWKKLPETQKQKVYIEIRKKFPSIVEKTFRDINKNITKIIDFKKIANETLQNDNSFVSNIFLDVGKKEFKFIERSGLVLGGIFGLIQLGVIIYFDDWWIFTIAGIIVGFLTNYVALQLIFKPVEEKKFLGIKLQGLFLRRQKEVAKKYSNAVTEKMLTTEQLFDAIFKIGNKNVVEKIIEKNIGKLIDLTIYDVSSFFRIFFDKKKIDIIKNIATYRFLQEVPIAMTVTHSYAEKKLKTQQTIEEKMANLPSKDFVNFLHPIFKQEEWKLIIAGAFLGGLAGIVQYFISFY